MGLYFRKSLRVGPLRFNLSGSGIGVSTGIPGFRIGTGPRGTYVHMGRNGFYYRATIPTTPRPARSTRARQQEHLSAPEIRPVGDDDISKMTDIDASGLLEELNSKARRTRLWPITAVCTILVLLLAASFEISPAMWWLTGFAGVVACGAAYLRDRLKKSVVIFYDLDGDMLEAYAGLLTALSNMAKCHRMWQLQGKGEVYDRKYQAGASHLVTRKRASIHPSVPPYVVSNVKVPTLPIGRSTLYFFPDRVLAFGNGQFGALAYSDLEAAGGQTRFIETDGVPNDATVVGQTWRYVNKDGGPDRRFNNNHQIPICSYEELTMSSRSGVSAIFQLSKVGHAGPLHGAFGLMSQALEELRRKPRPQIAEAALDLQAPPTAAIELVAQPNPKHFSTSLAVLCCVIVADGKLSVDEGSNVLAGMDELYSERDRDEVKQLMKELIQRIKTDGFAPVLEDTLEAAQQLQGSAAGHRLGGVLQKMKRKGNLKPREEKVCDRFVSIFSM